VQLQGKGGETSCRRKTECEKIRQWTAGDVGDMSLSIGEGDAEEIGENHLLVSQESVSRRLYDLAQLRDSRQKEKARNLGKEANTVRREAVAGGAGVRGEEDFSLLLQRNGAGSAQRRRRVQGTLRGYPGEKKVFLWK